MDPSTTRSPEDVVRPLGSIKLTIPHVRVTPVTFGPCIAINVFQTCRVMFWDIHVYTAHLAFLVALVMKTFAGILSIKLPKPSDKI